MVVALDRKWERVMTTTTNLRDELDEQQLKLVTGGFIPGLVQPVIIIGDGGGGGGGGGSTTGKLKGVSASAGAGASV
jgi:hypothetical protein